MVYVPDASLAKYLHMIRQIAKRAPDEEIEAGRLEIMNLNPIGIWTEIDASKYESLAELIDAVTRDPETKQMFTDFHITATLPITRKNDLARGLLAIDYWQYTINGEKKSWVEVESFLEHVTYTKYGEIILPQSAEAKN